LEEIIRKLKIKIIHNHKIETFIRDKNEKNIVKTEKNIISIEKMVGFCEKESKQLSIIS
jgi:hypothetical protein